ncbi:hypothetical protein KM043_001714 [Ampulex compressa]|nr:hypothetical protein KM043_001714 [Ampulex compressa]
MVRIGADRPALDARQADRGFQSTGNAKTCRESHRPPSEINAASKSCGETSGSPSPPSHSSPPFADTPSLPSESPSRGRKPSRIACDAPLEHSNGEY